MKKTISLKTAALQYKELSEFSVIPCGPDKKPLLRSWKEYQSRVATDEEIGRWWSQFPDANVGIVTGRVSGITVVDVDVHKGADAGRFPKTYAVKTGNGGLQLYYRYKEGLTVSANAYPDMPNVDIRNDGGFVVAPPSVTDYMDKGVRKGGKYEVADASPFADFPAHLFPESKKKASLKSRISVGTGSRNSSMASVIGTIIHPMDADKIMTEGWEAVQAINRTYVPPLKDRELRTTFESIAGKELGRRDKLLQTKFDIDFLSIETQSGKKIIQNTENICRALREHPEFKGRLAYDRFTNLFELDGKQLEDNDAINVQTGISVIFPSFIRVGKDMVYDAILKVCKENSYDSAVDYVKSIVWDGKKRLDSWLTTVYGTPDDVYHRAVGSNWLKGMVKRLIEPGCKFDYVLVLEGEQGIRKSTSLYVLGGAWYAETAMSTENKDFFMQFAGKSIIEFSEGETLSRTEVKRMKAIITMQSDRFRAPYERAAKDIPRRCVFAMTTNQEEYLKDETGNRRWLPIRVVKDADTEWLKDNRGQLFAEAYHRLTVLEETVYEFPKEETLAAQNARRVSDPNEDLIASWYWGLTRENREDGITVHQVYRDALHGYHPSKPMGKIEQMSIAGVLKSHLMLDKRETRRTGVKAMRWYNPNQEIDMVEQDTFESAFKSLES